MTISVTKEEILAEIQRLAALKNGQPPSMSTFEAESGLKHSNWRGKFWSRWNEALVEAGFEPNQPTARIDEADIYTMLVPLCRQIGHFPTWADMKLWRRNTNPNFPVQTIVTRIGIENIKLRFQHWLALQGVQHADLLQLLGFQANQSSSSGDNEDDTPLRDGSVYLMKSGEHFKIGKSEDIERRVKEIRVQMPESLVLVHAISTDDTAGIERYWHQRFESKRLNGEWFKLSKTDVAAFKKRKFQ